MASRQSDRLRNHFQVQLWDKAMSEARVTIPRRTVDRAAWANARTSIIQTEAIRRGNMSAQDYAWLIAIAARAAGLTPSRLLRILPEEGSYAALYEQGGGHEGIASVVRALLDDATQSAMEQLNDAGFISGAMWQGPDYHWWESNGAAHFKRVESKQFARMAEMKDHYFLLEEGL